MSEASGNSTDLFADLAEGMRICYRDIGDKTRPAVLLIAGLGEDLTYWTDHFFDYLVAHGFRVIALDNRDTGRSTFVQAAPPALWRQLAGMPREDAYSLEDMAGDVIGLLDHLRLDRVHLVGRSMGGMIAQIVTTSSPHRVLSLTTLYSTTGARGIGGQSWSTLRILATQHARTKTQAIIDHLTITQHIAGTAHPLDEVAETIIAGTAWDRCSGDQAAGVARQIQAVKAARDRTILLRKVAIPTLVINGDRDLMVNPSGGRALAAAITGARHKVIPGMGHHLPRSLVETVTGLIADHAYTAQATRIGVTED